MWPAELNRLTAETATLAEYLKSDLERIIFSLTRGLRSAARGRHSRLVEPKREGRIIDVSRAFAVLRVESTVRQLRRKPSGFQTERPSLPATGRSIPVVPPADAARSRTVRPDGGEAVYEAANSDAAQARESIAAADLS